MSAQCPHEVIAAVCLMPCGCGCDSCVRLAAAAEQEPDPDSRCRICGGTNGRHDGASHDARSADMPSRQEPAPDSEGAR